MDDSERPRKKGVSSTIWGAAVVLAVGVLIGLLISPSLEPWVHPERAALVAQAETLKTQNQLLKKQTDCLVNGIRLEKGSTTIEECT